VDISEIFQKYIPEYLQKYGNNIPHNHLKAINDILRCRTSDLGGSVFFCEKCDIYHYSYHSCKNRHCPKCGSQDSEKWLEKQKEKLLPVKYFMVTFTIPEELRSICRSNQKIFYSSFFRASASALKALLKDPQFAGGEAGFTGILHTWTRQLHYHTHIHYIVPGGAFDFERNCWNKAGHKFLVPVKALSSSFRKKFRKLLEKESLKLFRQIPQSIWNEKEFITNSIKVGKGETAFTYLANYVYKTAITNNRIVSCKDGRVKFKYKDSKTNETKFQTISALKFIRRFLQHILPSGFQKVRYYGFLSSSSKDKWKRIAEYFDLKIEQVETKKESDSKPKEVFCRKCKSQMIVFASIIRKPRAPPNLFLQNILQRTAKQIEQ